MSNFAYDPIHIVPSQTTVVGTTPVLVASVKLPVRKIPSISAWLGEETGAYNATVRFVRETGGATLLDLTAVAAIPAEVVATDTVVAAADEYHIFLLAADPAGVCICTRILIE